MGEHIVDTLAPHELGLAGEKLPQLVLIDSVPHRVSFRCESELTLAVRSDSRRCVTFGWLCVFGLLGRIEAACLARPALDARPAPNVRAA
jgi:hypothetical protein